ncbi:MAG: VapE domain-containing protein [Candidatus Kariarchaeaceae archaeon]|jgi:predicted P-loop ATPase
MNVKKSASLYISKGWEVVPLEPKTKNCYAPDWQKLKFTPDDFRVNDNIGIKSLNGLIDLDLDSPEVVSLADNFLPDTKAIYGRKSKPKSHRLYQCDNPPKKTISFLDLSAKGATKPTLIEIRVNHQSMAPPSIHPDGEKVEWCEEVGEAKKIAYGELLRAVRLLATTALLTRYYAQEGHRHLWIIPLCGTLRHLNLTEDETFKVVKVSGEYVKDGELGDRLRAVKSTYARGEDDPIASSKALVSTMLEGKSFLSSLQKIWGTQGRNHLGFLTNQQGKIIPNNQDNVLKALEKFNLEWWSDVFSHKLMVDGHPLDDAVSDHLWLKIDKQFHFQPGYQFYQRVMMDAIRQIPIHPVIKYLDGLKWDGKKRIDTWLTDYGGAAATPFNKSVSAIILIAAVRRVRYPGCKFDEMVILESQIQGVNKSQMLTSLVPDPMWVSDDLPLGVGAKEVLERTCGRWIIEASELHGRKRDSEKLKSFLSRQVDGPVRQAYARLPIEVKRQFVIVGTTNSSSYLKDPTGNRRFWPVEVQEFDLKQIKKDRDQLWAEANEREKAKESIRLNSRLWNVAAEQQETRRQEDAWEEPLENLFCDPHKNYRVTPGEIWDHLGVPMGNRNELLSSRISSIMRRMGFRKMTVRKADENGQKAYPIKGWGKDGSQKVLGDSEEN